MSLHDPLTPIEKAKITRLRKKLIGWYAKNGRDFPWRRNVASTFERICVEVLLQRTKAETVAAAYPDFFSRYDSWKSLSDAPITDLEDRLKPLGLWKRRARSIKKLANYAYDHGGIFPATEKELLEVPAVGQYVCNAVLLFQHGKSRPLIDVNMARVIERYIRPRRLADIRYDPWLQAACHWYVRETPIEANWAMLDFASIVCKSRSPQCEQCLLKQRCMFL